MRDGGAQSSINHRKPMEVETTTWPPDHGKSRIGAESFVFTALCEALKPGS